MCLHRILKFLDPIVSNNVNKKLSCSYLNDLEHEELREQLLGHDLAEQFSEAAYDALFTLVAGNNKKYIFVYVGTIDGVLFAQQAVALKKRYPNRKLRIAAFGLNGAMEALPTAARETWNEIRPSCDYSVLPAQDTDDNKFRIMNELMRNSCSYVHLCDEATARGGFDLGNRIMCCVFPRWKSGRLRL